MAELGRHATCVSSLSNSLVAAGPRTSVNLSRGARQPCAYLHFQLALPDLPVLAPPPNRPASSSLPPHPIIHQIEDSVSNLEPSPSSLDLAGLEGPLRQPHAASNMGVGSACLGNSMLGVPSMTLDVEAANPVYGSFVSIPIDQEVPIAYDLEIKSPSDVVVHRDLDKSEGEFHLLPQESGMYRFCLTVSTVKHNPMHGRGLMKEVVWDLHTSYYHVENHEKDSLKDNDAEDLWHYVHNVESMIQQVRSTQQYLYWKERRHRQTVDSTNSRVWWAAITRCLGLITVSVSQIIFIRRLFMR
eukprot:gene22808-29974_t